VVSRPNTQPPSPPSPTRPWLAALALVGAVVLYYVLPMRGPLWPLGAIAGPIAAIALAPLTRRHLRRVLVSDRPIADVACAIAIIAVVLVLGFATTYWILDTQSPDEFVGIDTKTDSLYFTVTVLATVGFGDVHPVGQVGRAVTTVNMLTNIVILAVSVRLFGWAAHQRADVVQQQVAARSAGRRDP
jgi:voltage-gated potassium channel